MKQLSSKLYRSLTGTFLTIIAYSVLILNGFKNTGLKVWITKAKDIGWVQGRINHKAD